MTDVLVQFLPMTLVDFVIAILMAIVATKIGRSPILWFVLSVIPVVNLFFVWIAVWKFLIDLHRRLGALENRAGQI